MVGAALQVAALIGPDIGKTLLLNCISRIAPAVDRRFGSWKSSGTDASARLSEEDLLALIRSDPLDPPPRTAAAGS